MSYWALGILAVGLGADAFSMAIGIGLEGVRRRDAFLLGLVVALFHVFMPWIGIVLGTTLGHFIGQLATYIGAAVLFFLGGRMLFHAWKKEPEDPLHGRNLPGQGMKLPGSNRTWGNRQAIGATAGTAVAGRPFTPTLWGLIVIGAAVSMDALSVGFSLGTVGAQLVPTILTFGVVAGIMTVAGALIGRQVSQLLGSTAQIVGGLILLGIGIKLLIG
ncbi:manganese efflux pump [Heliobacterium chlorum]|uniref:Putative manganese efflux pump MntP n=1 Tax=Heliobacterium chlorum TaxID=2698 RepID=A0ABR7T177_HELCL|nr:manganese efflux pump MntP family protein [Heliobacterium chlorum]MBC9784532.1 manganese efflux pump [Heliobacterium chlorum]